eukprot:594882-Pyramimonas_sp.AAC.1
MGQRWAMQLGGPRLERPPGGLKGPPRGALEWGSSSGARSCSSSLRSLHGFISGGVALRSYASEAFA